MQKRPFDYAILIPLFFITTISGALLPNESDQKEEDAYSVTNPMMTSNPEDDIFDYTAYHLTHTQSAEEVNHKLDRKIQNISEHLAIDMLTFQDALTGKKKPLLLLALLRNKENKQNYKYLFVSHNFRNNIKLQMRSHNPKFAYHLVKAKSKHVLLQLIGWLQKSKRYDKIVHLYSSGLVCQQCSLLIEKMWGLSIESNEKGCLGCPFPDLRYDDSHVRTYIDEHLSLPLVAEVIFTLIGYIHSDTQIGNKEEIIKLTKKMKHLCNKLQKQKKSPKERLRSPKAKGIVAIKNKAIP